ncbi:MAG: ComEC/Rec2 family competence protein [Patescibacteria group bacterium]
MTASRVFLYFCLAFVAGVFFDSVFQISQLFMLGILIVGLILITVFWRYPEGKPAASYGASKNFAIAGFCILFLVLGIWRHQGAEMGIINNELVKFNDSGESITIEGIVAEEPSIKEKSIKLIINNEQGRVLITTNRYPEYQYGDKLKITGKLKTPSEDIEGFNYKEYLSKDGIYSEMSWPGIEVVSKNQGNFIFSKILSLKEKLREVIYQNLSPPQSSVLGAVILGDKRQLSEDLKNKLNIAGVRHIAAISGMHITILAGILMAFFISLGFWRSQAFYFAVALLVLYIVMVGAPVSAIRAGIMGGLFLLGQKTGRISASSRAIVFVAAAMLFQNPLLLKLDVGFQLSFLAVMGIIHLLPFLQDWLRFVPNPGIFPLRSVLAMTISAQIFTLPILIYNFGYFSLVAPLVNILIVPLLSFVMISGFFFGLAGIFFPVLGWIFSWPAWLLLTYIILIVDFFSRVPFAAISAENISWGWLALFYLILGFFVWRQKERQKLKFLNY